MTEAPLRPSLLRRAAAAALSSGVRRVPGGMLGHIIRFFAVLTAAFTVYAATMSTWDVLARTIVFLTMMLTMLFLLVGATPRSRGDRPSNLDFLLSAASFACLVFFALEMEEIAVRITLFDPLPLSYWIFGYGLLLLALEAARRTVGIGLTAVVLVFMAYNLWGHTFDGPLKHGYISLGHFLDVTVFTTDGVFGVPMQVSATYAFFFVMFGTFLERAGGGAFFFDLAASLTGRSRGGPSKIAVVSSGLFGMISGSPTADVVTTGSVTIPVMRRLGYPSQLAAGIEVAASTGGSILPPVMGAAVFIMAEFTGIPYVSICFAAAASALLYYAAVFLQVDLRARRLNVGELDPATLPRARKVLAEGWMFIVPLAVLTFALVEHFSPTFVAVYGIIALLAVWVLRWRSFSVRAVYEALGQTTTSMVAVTGACAAAGMVIGGITMTGLAGKVSELLVLIAGANEFLTLVIAAAMTILLGMGMPTPASYALAAALVGPTLVGNYGLSLMQAHLFLLYYAVLSAMTPPVAVAAYAASAIADANPVGIAATACKLAVAAFVLPFAFVYAPGLILEGGFVAIVLDVLRCGVGVIAIAIAAEGYWRQPLPPVVRVAIGAGGLALLSGQPLVALAGAVCVAAVAGLGLTRQKSTQGSL